MIANWACMTAVAETRCLIDSVWRYHVCMDSDRWMNRDGGWKWLFQFQFQFQLEIETERKRDSLLS